MKNIWLIFCMLACLAGCSDSGGEYNEIEHKAHNFFVFDVGSYWVFEAYDVDRYEDQIFGTERTDSLVITNKETSGGEIIYDAEFFKSGALNGTFRFKTGDYDLYIWNFEIDKGFPIENKWYKLLGYKYSGLWNLTTVEKIDTLANGQVSKYNMLANGYFGEDGVSTFDGAKVSTASYYVGRNKKLVIAPAGDTINISYSEVSMNRTYFTFAEGIGIYRIYEKPYYATIRENGGLAVKYYNGVRLQLKRFKL